MRILKQSLRRNPKVSLILLDWRVRESFHLLHYLKTQTIARDSFEVIVIEYYDHVSTAVRKFESEVDTWVLLQMPDDCYYHKHLMYNTGIVFSKGDILMFGDSDAMVRPTFIESIVTTFERDPFLVYHMDEFRSVRRDLYPFNYPSFEEVLGDGCINNVGGKTKGLLDVVDPIHTRNYGACMCSRREDVIAVGGADEDVTYLGHICGPYDMTFRLMNFGRRLKWDTDEYLYHTWHPGTDGTDNYLGPHDGMNMSTTALQALCSGRVPPLVENPAIRELRTSGAPDREASPALVNIVINPEYKEKFSRRKLGASVKSRVVSAPSDNPVFASYKGFDIYEIGEVFYGVPKSMGAIDPAKHDWGSDDRVIAGTNFSEIRSEVDSSEARLIETVSNLNICAVGQRYAVVPQSLGPVDFRLRKHRTDTRVTWADNLAEARTKAAILTSAGREPRRANVEVKGAAVPSDAHRTPGPGSISLFSQQIDQLNQRLSQVEADVVNIYRSRIWRTLVWIGGLLNVVFGNWSRSR